jgi:plasmid stabilization system protein ParE
MQHALRYTTRALREIDEAISYISNHSPQGADNVAARIHEVLLFLQEQLFAGIAIPRKNTRRFFLKPYPYTVYYRVGPSEIIIQRFRHTSRKSQ